MLHVFHRNEIIWQWRKVLAVASQGAPDLQGTPKALCYEEAPFVQYTIYVPIYLTTCINTGKHHEQITLNAHKFILVLFGGADRGETTGEIRI